MSLPTIALIEAELLRRKQNKIESFFPDTGALRRELYPKHVEFFAAGAIHRERLFLAGNRVGKALKHGTKVATPTGWTTIEALKVGDTVIAGDGKQTRVAGVYPQGIKPMYKLRFDVGEEIECCAEHLWTYQHPRARFATRWSHAGEEANPFFGEWRTAN